MKFSRGCVGAAAAAIVATIVIPSVRAEDPDVYHLRGALEGRAQAEEPVTGAPTIEPVKLNARRLVNLALGRPLWAPRMTNEVLALVHQCGEPGAELVVFDRVSTSVLASVARLTIVQDAVTNEVHGVFHSEFIGQLQGGTVGGDENAILASDFRVAGLAIHGPEGCATSITLGVVGTIDIRANGINSHLLVPIGALTSRPILFKLPPPPPPPGVTE